MTTTIDTTTTDTMLDDTTTDTYPLLDKIIAFEDGTLPVDETAELFQYLVDTGMAWTLQGVYGRTACDLIDAGQVAA